LKRLKILVSGKVAQVPFQGGATWAVLQYILGFKRLGHIVYFLEPILDPVAFESNGEFPVSDRISYFQKVCEDFSLGRCASLVGLRGDFTVGLASQEIAALLQDCDVLVNLGGSLPVDERVARIPVRVYLDLDPGFTQLWSEVERVDVGLEGHTHFVTIGPALGSSTCPIPTGRLCWEKTLQPVFLEQWPCARLDSNGPYTTVANWRSYGSIAFSNLRYGQKAHSWRSLINIPQLSRREFLIALSIHPGDSEDLELLSENGWRLVDPLEVAGSPESYQKFIGRSRGEIAVAKSGYVHSRCAWFSERSACYLAMGKPVVAQDTGFSSVLPCGKGLFAFQTAEEAATSIEEIEADYVVHSKAAREIALEFFDSVPCRRPATIGRDMTLKYYEAGHILGSAYCLIKTLDEGRELAVLYTGDMGRFDKPIIRNPTLEFAEEDRNIDLLVMESTYGNRLHGPVRDLKKQLEKALTETFARRGSVIIPSFAFGRTQELLYVLSRLDANDSLRKPWVQRRLVYLAPLDTARIGACVAERDRER